MGFLQLRRQYQISHEVRRGAQRASPVVLGTSGLRACGEGECVIALVFNSAHGFRAQLTFAWDHLVNVDNSIIYLSWKILFSFCV